MDAEGRHPEDELVETRKGDVPNWMWQTGKSRCPATDAIHVINHPDYYGAVRRASRSPYTSTPPGSIPYTPIHTCTYSFYISLHE